MNEKNTKDSAAASPPGIKPKDTLQMPSAYQPKTRKSLHQMHTLGLVMIIAGSVCVGLLSGIAVGAQLAKSKTTTNVSNFGVGGQSQGGSPGSGQMGQPGGMRTQGNTGIVIKVADESITVKNQMQNTSTIYVITNDTTITDNGSSASIDDIKVGDTVAVKADEDASSSSITATSIQINPTAQSTQNTQSNGAST